MSKYNLINKNIILHWQTADKEMLEIAHKALSREIQSGLLTSQSYRQELSLLEELLKKQ